MNKKLLLSSLVATGVLTSALLTSNVNAATIDGKTLASSISKNGNDYIMSVALPSDNSNYKGGPLTRKNVVEMLKTKYATENVTSIKNANTVITGDSDAVGTGCVVELSSGKKLTVVLYGDVNGDGKISSQDSLAISKHNVAYGTSKDIITDQYKLKAADLTGNTADSKLRSVDSLRIAYYNLNLVGKDAKHGMTIVDSAIYPEDTKVVNTDEVLEDAVEEINKVTSEDYTITLDTTTNTGRFVFADKEEADATIKATNYHALVNNLATELNKYEDSIDKIVLTYNNQTAELKAGMTERQIIDVAKTLLGENASSIKISELLGKDLKANFYIKDGAEFLGMTGSNVEYTLLFTKSTDTILKEALESIKNNEEEKGYTITLDDEKNEGTFTFNKDENDNVQISAFKDLAGDLSTYLTDNKESINNIELKFGENTATLTPDMDEEAIIKVAKELLGEDVTTVEQLLEKAQKLEATFNLVGDSKPATYTLNFTQQAE